MTDTKPRGRSMKELHAIVAAEEARRIDLMDAWDNLTESAQADLVLYAQGLAAALDAAEASA